MRAILFRAGWLLAWPLRAYVRRGPASPSRTLVQAALGHTILRLAPATFLAQLPAGGTIELRYDERIGLSTLLMGTFEAAETERLFRLARPGTTAIDAGANVGMFTIPLAHAVGPSGRVLAFEPAPPTAARLRANARLNALENVTVVEVALGRAAGEGTLELASDAAYNTLGTGASGVPVTIACLDDVWEEHGRPEVSVLKADVEGGELELLEGAASMLRACRPAVLVELAEPGLRRAVEEFMQAEGYRRVPAEGFQPWNQLFLPDSATAPSEPEPLVH